MKKTEKIEVRVSHEEKERLMELAEKRNQNISDLIRDRMAGNYTMPAQSLSRDVAWNRAMSAVALAFASIAFLWGILGFIWNAPASPPPVMSMVILFEDYAPENGPPSKVLQTQIAHRDGFSQTYAFKVKGDVFETRHVVEETSEGVFLLKMDVCRKIKDACNLIDQGELILSQPSAYARMGVMKFFEGDRSTFFAQVMGSSTPKPVGPAES